MHCALFWYRHKQVIFVLLLPCSTWADWKSWLVAEEMKCVNDGGVLEDVISAWDLDTLAVLQLVHRCDSVSSFCHDFVFLLLWMHELIIPKPGKSCFASFAFWLSISRCWNWCFHVHNHPLCHIEWCRLLSVNAMCRPINGEIFSGCMCRVDLVSVCNSTCCRKLVKEPAAA